MDRVSMVCPAGTEPSDDMSLSRCISDIRQSAFKFALGLTFAEACSSFTMIQMMTCSILAPRRVLEGSHNLGKC